MRIVCACVACVAMLAAAGAVQAGMISYGFDAPEYALYAGQSLDVPVYLVESDYGNTLGGAGIGRAAARVQTSGAVPDAGHRVTLTGFTASADLPTEVEPTSVNADQLSFWLQSSDFAGAKGDLYGDQAKLLLGTIRFMAGTQAGDSTIFQVTDYDTRDNTFPFTSYPAYVSDALDSGNSRIFDGNVTITIIAPEFGGDTNGDGIVDAADYIALKQNFGAGPGATLAQGDVDGDGFVNWADLQILMTNFGHTMPGAPAPAPEPASAMLLVFGAAALLRRRAGIGWTRL